MDTATFAARLRQLEAQHSALVNRPNTLSETWRNGGVDRWTYPILTAAHTPFFWRYDLNPATNPHLMERMGINGVFNAAPLNWTASSC